MTPTDLRVLVERATSEPWGVVSRGDGARAEPAIVFDAARMVRIIVDHGRDFGDPAPDADLIVALRHLALPLLDVVEAAEAAYKAPDALAVRAVLGPALAALRRAIGDGMICNHCGKPIRRARVEIHVWLAGARRFTGLAWHPQCAPVEREHIVAEASALTRRARETKRG